ncbi:MAG: hypothetical protein IJ481_02450 [Alphaproteobacteria bacterium]|nr:hypothetical protein [Alphaproteobacteria bacterium]
MLPQLDSSTYLSQFFWLIVCLFVLVFVLKKYCLPAINDTIANREKMISNYKHDIDNLESDIKNIETELRNIKTEKLLKINRIIKAAVDKSDNAVAEQIEQINKENEMIVGSVRRRLKNELKSLSTTFEMQLDIAANNIFETLFMRVK